MLFVRGVIFIWGNFTCFILFFFNLMINGYMPLIETFLFSSFTYYYFLHKVTTTYDIPFLQIHTTSHFLLVSCYIINVNQRWITKVLFQTMSKICRSFQNRLRYLYTWKITSLQMVSFFFKKRTPPLKMRRYGMVNLKDSDFSLMVKPILVVLLLVL